MKNHCVQFYGLYIMEITRLDRFLWFVYNENEPLCAISWFIYNENEPLCAISWFIYNENEPLCAISWFIYNGNHTTGPFSMVCI